MAIFRLSGDYEELYSTQANILKRYKDENKTIAEKYCAVEYDKERDSYFIELDDTDKPNPLESLTIKQLERLIEC